MLQKEQMSYKQFCIKSKINNNYFMKKMYIKKKLSKLRLEK